MDVSIIIVSFNTREITLDCLNSIYANPPKFLFETIVVDNNSTDGTVEDIKKRFKDVRIIRNNENVGFSKANNQGFNVGRGKYFLLLNSDTIVDKGELDKLFEFANIANFGILSCKLLNRDGSLQPNFGDLPTMPAVIFWISGLDGLINSLPTTHQNHRKYYNSSDREVGWVSGSVMLVKREVVEKIKGFDEKIFMYGEDMEICMRAKMHRFKIGWTNLAKITHFGGKSSIGNPSYNQWLGEFKGVEYIYGKYYGGVASIILKLIFYLFIALRVVVFTLMGRINYAKSYAKIFTKI